MLRLATVAVLALALGTQVGCSDECDDLSCDPIGASVRVTTPDPLRITVCLDDDCRELEDGRQVEGTDVSGGFSGWEGISLPDEEIHIEVEVRDDAGQVLATFDETRKPSGGRCSCGRYAAFRFDGDSLEWWDA